MAETLALTGAAGRLGGLLRPVLAEAGHTLRLTDRKGLGRRRPNESFLKARLENGAAMRQVCRGASSLVHLGGASLEAPWPELIAANVTGLSAVFEAARVEGVRRIVFASSLHVLGMHPRPASLHEDSPLAPDSRYAATKVFGEAACRLLAEKHGLSVVILRIGHVVDEIGEAAPGLGVAAEDLARVVILALGAEGPGCQLWHAVAPHAGYDWSDGRLAATHGFAYRQAGPDRAEIERRIAADPGLGSEGKARRGHDFAEEGTRAFPGWPRGPATPPKSSP